MDKTSRTSWMRWIISYVWMFSLNPFCRLNLTTSCWVLLQALFHLTSQAGCWGLGLAQLWIRKSFIPLHSRGNLGRRMAEESTPIQDSDRSASEDSFLLPLLLSHALPSSPGLLSTMLVAQWWRPWLPESLRIRNWETSRLTWAGQLL